MSKVSLREIERSDLATINRWRSDRSVLDCLGAAFRYVAIEVDERWYEQYLAGRNNNIRLAICLPEGRLVGAVYLLDIDWVSRSAEYAIWIGEPSAQGKKSGETATRLALDHAFGDLNLERIHLCVLTHNKRAIQLYRKIGFVEEGVQRRATFKNGRYHDLLMMAVLRDEYVLTQSSVAD